MSDTAISPAAGSASLTGKAGKALAWGITFPVASDVSTAFGNKTSDRALNCTTVSHTFILEELQKDCTTAIGYIPANVTVIAWEVNSADLDSGGSPAIVQSLLLGSATLVTGIVTGKAGTIGFYPCVPTATTAPTLCHLKVTTAAAAAQVGAVSITAFYYSS